MKEKIAVLCLVFTSMFILNSTASAGGLTISADNIGIGTDTPASPLDVQTDTEAAIRGTSTISSSGSGVGYGVRGEAYNDSSSPGDVYGVYGFAYSGAGFAYGVYGESAGGFASFAGYFNGAVNVTGNQTVGGTLNVTSGITAASFSGSGAGLTEGTIPGAALVPGSLDSAALAPNAVAPANIDFYGNVAIVAPNGGDYDNPATAMTNYGDWCPSPSEDTPCLLKIMPGLYDVGSSPVVMQPFIDIEGSGENVTKITGAISTSFPASTGAVKGENNAEIRFLTVENTGGGTTTAAIFNSSKSPSILHVTATVSSGHYRYGVYNSGSSPTMTNVSVTVTDETTDSNYGVYNSSSSPMMTNVRVTVTKTGGSGATTYGVYNTSSSPIMTNVTVSASGGDESYGVLNFNSSPTITNLTAEASGSGTNRGVSNSGTGVVEIRDSSIKASGGAVPQSLYNYGAQAHMFVGITKLDGAVLNDNGALTCIGAYDTTLNVLDASCLAP